MKYKGIYPTKILHDNKVWVLDHTYREYPESFVTAYAGKLESEPVKKTPKKEITEIEVTDNGI